MIEIREFDNAHNCYRYIEHVLEESPEYEYRMLLSNMFESLDDLLNTCVIQLQRISTDSSNLENPSKFTNNDFSRRLSFTKLWADCYFFLNTVERAYRLTKRIYIHLGETQKAQSINDDFNFNNLRIIRNCIEHMDENLTDGLQKSKKYLHDYQYRNINWFNTQYRGMTDNTIELKGHKFKFDESSLKYLYECYDDITSIITNRYVSPNKKNVDEFWKPFFDL